MSEDDFYELSRKYHGLEDCLKDDSHFWKLLDELEANQMKSVKESEESAIKAHYKLIALNEVRGVFQALKNSYLIEKQNRDV